MRFCMIFDSLGLKQKEFGERLGLSQSQISTILGGKSNVSGPTIQLLWHNFRVNPDFILHGSSPMFLPPKIEARRIIPIIADIAAGDWKYWYDSYAAGAGDDYVSCPDITGDHLFAVRVEGDSMEPKLVAGDILIIDPELKFDGGIAVVRHDEGFKIRFVRKLSKDRYLLRPLNPAHPDKEITPGADTRFYVPVKKISLSDI